MASKTIADMIRSIKPGRSKLIEAHNANTVRVTAHRLFGPGQFKVTTVSGNSCRAYRRQD